MRKWILFIGALILWIPWFVPLIYHPYPRYTVQRAPFVRALLGFRERPVTSSTGSTLKEFAKLLNQYKSACGSYPLTSDGLQTLLQKTGSSRPCSAWQSERASRLLPIDGWGWPLHYESNGVTFSLLSLGRDGSVGGQHCDEDFGYKEGIDEQLGPEQTCP